MTVEPGTIVEAEVVKILEYGAIVELPDGNSGLVHISEVADEYVSSVSEYLREGDSVSVKVLGKKDEKRWELSLRQAQEGAAGAAASAPSRSQPRRRPSPDFEKRLSEFITHSNRRLNELQRNRSRKR